jgi:hypothetical protein
MGRIKAFFVAAVPVSPVVNVVYWLRGAVTRRIRPRRG